MFPPKEGGHTDVTPLQLQRKGMPQNEATILQRAPWNKADLADTGSAAFSLHDSAIWLVCFEM